MPFHRICLGTIRNTVGRAIKMWDIDVSGYVSSVLLSDVSGDRFVLSMLIAY